jgi:hypothetical protein
MSSSVWKEMYSKPPLDTLLVKKPHDVSHYNKGNIECIDAIKASMELNEFAAFCKGNVIKYNWRYKDKGGVKDLYKAQDYQKWMIETEEEMLKNE